MRRLERVIPDAPRPFRIYNSKARRFFRWYLFKYKDRAMKQAFWIAHWVPGVAVELIDIRNGNCHGVYVGRRVGEKIVVEAVRETIKTHKEFK